LHRAKRRAGGNGVTLPVCPYCGARFLYGQVKRMGGRGTGKCPHCGKVFRISSGRGRAVLFSVTAAALVCLNLLLMQAPAVSMAFLLGVTAAGVVAAWLLLPYTARYRRR
jgi:transposase-like protein